MEISKLKSQLFFAFGQVTAARRPLQNALVKLRRSIPSTLQSFQAARRSVENGLRKAVESSRAAIVTTNREIRGFGTQLSNGFGQTTIQLRRARITVTRLARSGAYRFLRLREALRPVENLLRRAVGNSRDGIVLINRSIGKSRSRLFSAFEQEAVRFRRAQSTFRELSNRVIEKPRKLRQELHTRENELRDLLASSLDAIVVTNNNRRFVAANQKALEFFGVSE